MPRKLVNNILVDIKVEEQTKLDQCRIEHLSTLSKVKSDEEKDIEINNNIQSDPIFRAFAAVAAEQWGMTIPELKAAIKAKMQ